MASADNTSCGTSCPNGEYNVEGKCNKCLDGCKTCNDKTKCTSCMTDLDLDTNGTCVDKCSSGTYGKAGVCTPCHEACTECFGDTIS